MTLTLRAAVGRNSPNNFDDVRYLQESLNEAMPSPMRPLAISGRMDQATQDAIISYQRNILGQQMPSGVIAPTGPEVRALNGGGGTGAAAGVPIPANATAHERAVITRMAAAAQTARSTAALAVLRRLVEADNYNHFKNLLNAVGSMQWTGEFVNAVRTLSDTGLPPDRVAELFTSLLRRGRMGDFQRFVSLMAANRNLGASVARLARVGSALNAVAVVLCAAEVVNHWNNGRYGPAVAEIYGVVMQIGVPWAGFLDGVQTIIYSYAPGLRSRSSIAYVFRLLNAVNPIGAGKTFVDSYISTCISVAVSVESGQLDIPGFDRQIERMRASPMSVFVEFGEWLGSFGGPDVQRATHRGVQAPR